MLIHTARAGSDAVPEPLPPVLGHRHGPRPRPVIPTLAPQPTPPARPVTPWRVTGGVAFRARTEFGTRTARIQRREHDRPGCISANCPNQWTAQMAPRRGVLCVVFWIFGPRTAGRKQGPVVPRGVGFAPSRRLSHMFAFLPFVSSVLRSLSPGTSSFVEVSREPPRASWFFVTGYFLSLIWFGLEVSATLSSTWESQSSDASWEASHGPPPMAASRTPSGPLAKSSRAKSLLIARRADPGGSGS